MLSVQSWKRLDYCSGINCCLMENMKLVYKSVIVCCMNCYSKGVMRGPLRTQKLMRPTSHAGIITKTQRCLHSLIFCGLITGITPATIIHLL